MIRYATGGGIGPNEMETVIYLDWMQKNVLKGYGKDYTVDMTFTRGTPEAGTLLAAGQADMGTLSFAVFATSVLKNIVPGGMSIVSDDYQDGRPGYAQKHVLRAQGCADRLDTGPQGQEGRHQRRSGRPSISHCVSSSRRMASTPPQGPHHREESRCPDRATAIRKAHRLRHPDPTVIECRNSERAICGRCSPAATRSAPIR